MSSSGRARRSPEQVDALRARMVREGYPLSDLTRRENDRLWISLTQRRRRVQLRALLGMDDAVIDERIKAISAHHFELTGRK